MLSEFSIRLIRLYQGSLRLIMPACCRFHPTCSEYAIEALAKYGFFKGAYLALVRLLHCHPLSGKTGNYPLT